MSIKDKFQKYLNSTYAHPELINSDTREQLQGAFDAGLLVAHSKIKKEQAIEEVEQYLLSTLQGLNTEDSN